MLLFLNFTYKNSIKSNDILFLLLNINEKRKIYDLKTPNFILFIYPFLLGYPFPAGVS